MKLIVLYGPESSGKTTTLKIAYEKTKKDNKEESYCFKYYDDTREHNDFRDVLLLDDSFTPAIDNNGNISQRTNNGTKMYHNKKQVIIKSDDGYDDCVKSLKEMINSSDDTIECALHNSLSINQITGLINDLTSLDRIQDNKIRVLLNITPDVSLLKKMIDDSKTTKRWFDSGMIDIDISLNKSEIDDIIQYLKTKSIVPPSLNAIQDDIEKLSQENDVIISTCKQKENRNSEKITVPIVSNRKKVGFILEGDYGFVHLKKAGAGHHQNLYTHLRSLDFCDVIVCACSFLKDATKLSEQPILCLLYFIAYYLIAHPSGIINLHILTSTKVCIQTWPHYDLINKRIADMIYNRI